MNQGWLELWEPPIPSPPIFQRQQQQQEILSVETLKERVKVTKVSSQPSLPEEKFS